MGGNNHYDDDGDGDCDDDNDDNRGDGDDEDDEQQQAIASSHHHHHLCRENNTNKSYCISNKNKPGILRLDINKPRRSSGGSVEFRNEPDVLGERLQDNEFFPTTSDLISPQASVKWAFPPIASSSSSFAAAAIPTKTTTTTGTTKNHGENDINNARLLYYVGKLTDTELRNLQKTIKYKKSTEDNIKERKFIVSPSTLSRSVVNNGNNEILVKNPIQMDESEILNLVDSYPTMNPLDLLIDDRQQQYQQLQHQQQQQQQSQQQQQHHHHHHLPQYNSEDEDYSISVSAVMQRRASTKGHRKKGGYISPRRASSPMGHVVGMSNCASGVGSMAGSFDRRRSSVYTTSSGETAISMGDGTHQESTKEQIFENIRLHKEVLQSVKLQPWSMRRKLRLVRQAKEYVARHEGALQERFAMSRSTKDLWARFKILLAARWQHYKRELANISTVLIPWELRIKEIESHFGSVVASYFTFLRWLFWVNIVIAVALTIFVVMPEFFATQWPPKKEDHRKNMLPQEKANATRLISIWDFEGFLKYSPLFYGYYSDFSGAVRWHYDLPLAYFLTGLVVYIYSFWATLRKMAENSRMSKLSSKDDECVFSWKLFTGWDYMIGHAETAHNRIASVVLGFKEALLEEAEKKKDKRNWKVIVLRGIVNLLVLQLLGVSAFAVVTVVNRSTEDGATDSYWRRNEITVVITAISFFFPIFFEALGLLESYHPRKQLRMQLARIMALNLLNLYALIIALFDKIGAMNKTLICLKENITQSRDLMESQPYQLQQVASTIVSSVAFVTSTIPNLILNETSADFLDIFSSPMTDEFSTITENIYENISDFTTIAQNLSNCYQVPVNCTTKYFNKTALVTSLLLLNFTTQQPPTQLFSTQNNDELFLSTKFTFPDNTSSFIDSENFTNIANVTEFDDSNYNMDNFTFYDEFFYDWQTNTTGTTLSDTNAGTNNTTTNPQLPINWRKKRSNKELTEHSNGNENDLNFYDAMSDLYASLHELNSTDTINYGNDNNSMTSTTTSEIIDDIYSTFSTFLENITTSMNELENNTSTINPRDFINDKFYEFLENEYGKENFTTNGVEDAEDQCFITICEPDETTDMSSDMPITLPYDDDDDGTQEVSSTIPPDLLIDIFNVTQYNFEFSSSNSVDTTISPILSSFPFTTDSSAINYENVTQYFHAHESLTKFISHMDSAEQLALRKLCWETMFGQELVKLTVMDLVVTITSIICMDFFRALFVRFCNKCWCWDLEKRYPKYGDFKIAENILHLVNNQGQVWMGMFFSPGLAILNLVKLVIIMYLRSWAVLTCNVPHEVVFRASRSNNFYLALLLTMLFLCVLPVGYAIVWLKPSWHCGPFSKYSRIYLIFTDTLRKVLPPQLHRPLDYIASPSTVIPLLLLLILIIYYLVSLTGALREANQDLRIQLRRERTEGRRKMLKLPKTDDSDGNGGNAMDRWRKVLEASSPITPTSTGLPVDNEEEVKTLARKELLARIMKKALRKGSNTSDDESQPINPGGIGGGGGGDDETDTEQHESLPRDHEIRRSIPKLLRLKANTKNHNHQQQHRQSIDEKSPTIEIDSQLTVAPQSRKSSMAQMFKMAVKKEVKEHPNGRFKIEKVSHNQENYNETPVSSTNVQDVTRKKHSSPTLIPPPSPADNDQEYQAKIVSERRRSILLRQNNLIENSGTMTASATTNDKHSDNKVNYKIVNEKNQDMEKRTKLKSAILIRKNSAGQQQVAAPSIIATTGSATVATSENVDFSDDDNTSYREIELKQSSLSDRHSSNETSWNQNNAASNGGDDGNGESIKPLKSTSQILPKQQRNDSSPEYAVIDRKKYKTKSNSNAPEDEYPDIPYVDQSTVNIISEDKPKRRFTSFLALVREVVSIRKQEKRRIQSQKAANAVINAPIPEDDNQQQKQIASSSNGNNGSGSTTYEIKKRRNSSHKMSKKKPKPKRQDSQTSIWSDNIPVITISKTESDECILEAENVKPQHSSPPSSVASSSSASTGTKRGGRKNEHRKSN